MSATSSKEISGYVYSDSRQSHAHNFLLPRIGQIIASRHFTSKRAFDLGCGNGAVASWLAQKGWEVAGVDPSEQGIAEANKSYPHINLSLGSCYDDLAAKFGGYSLIISLEVVEHVYDPRSYALCLNKLLNPGGIALISTPYHGYLKNLVLAATGKLDAHFTALWDHGHIKFWSIKTINALLKESGLSVVEVHRVGRIPTLARSMIIVAEKSSH